MIWPNLVDSRSHTKTKTDLKNEGLNVYVHFDLQSRRQGSTFKEEDGKTRTGTVKKRDRRNKNKHKQRWYNKSRGEDAAAATDSNQYANANMNVDENANVDYDFTQAVPKSNSHYRSNSEPFTNLKKKLQIYAGTHGRSPSSPLPLPSPSLSEDTTGIATPIRNNSAKHASSSSSSSPLPPQLQLQMPLPSPLSVISETVLRVPTLNKIPKIRKTERKKKRQQLERHNSNSNGSTMSVSSSSSWSSSSASSTTSPNFTNMTRRRLYSWTRTSSKTNDTNNTNDVDLIMAGEQQRHSFDDYYHRGRSFDDYNSNDDEDSSIINNDDSYDDEGYTDSEDDDNMNEDCDASLTSINTSGSELTQVHGASIRINNNDGVIAFEFNDTIEDETANEKSDHDSDELDEEDDRFNQNSNNDIMNASLHSMDLSELTRSNGNGNGNGNSNFELSSTALQKDRDNKKKQFHSVRLACLEVAAEQYKEMNIEVPDIIVAQVNDHRNQLHDCDKKQQQRSYDAQEGRDTQNNRNGTTSKATNNSSHIKRQPKKSNKKQRQRIRLRRSDEIHVSPCQCALSLVGMRGQLAGHDSSWNGGESLFGNLLTTREDYSSVSSNLNTTCTIVSTTTTHDTVHDDDRNNGGKKSSIFSKKKATDSPMVRTHSAFVREVSSSGHLKIKEKKSLHKNESMTHSNAPKPKKMSSHNRTYSGTFDAVGYHEITLIRNRETKPKGIFSHYNGNNNNTPKGTNNNADFLDWDAITIRCSNHDELDILVKALKDTSKATVVPFSSNPKERLKKNKEQIKRKKKTAQKQYRRMKIDSPNSLSVNNDTPRSLDRCQPCSSSYHSLPEALKEALSDDTSLAMNNSEPGENHLDDQIKHEFHNSNQMENNSKTENEKRSWDFNFNKKEYCELCDLHFTLLTRRHHCRKCERSCCRNCSSLLLVKGGDEKRFCNICSADILRKQSEALRGRWKTRSHQSDRLPGKVHPACHKLGVGTVGKLPHWKTFMTTKVDERPAVGRITIEVLQAIALPSIDMFNGKTDPYVRATITGYDRDMMWTLREWMQQKRYSLCSGYVSSTLSPQWIGPGTKGGELLTLPLISTAGAVLRLEVLHYNVMTNARGKDTVLGVVEIPLSDLPNANLRQPNGIKLNAYGKKKNMLYDGYCERWYRLLPSDEVNPNSVVLSKPMPSPHSKEAGEKEKKAGVGLKSLEEIGKKVQGLCIQPIEWLASAIKLDLPARRPEAICKEHEARSFVHVRIKLNASVQGDILSHSWFPPVKPRPSVPPFDPQILFGRIMLVARQLAPYQKIQKYVEKVIKWEHEPKVCVRAYFIFAIHLALLPYVVKIFHVYLFIFLGIRLREMKLYSSDDDSITGDIPQVESMNSDGLSYDNKKDELNFHDSPSLTELNEKKQKTGDNESKTVNTNEERPSNDVNNVDETAKLHIAVNWIAKKWLDNKGLEILQFKLRLLARDLKNLNSVWNGANPLLTRAAMVYLAASFALHFVINPRILWLMGTFAWYFGRSPAFVLSARMFFGFWRGVAKDLRRQHLLDAEILDTELDTELTTLDRNQLIIKS